MSKKGILTIISVIMLLVPASCIGPFAAPAPTPTLKPPPTAPTAMSVFPAEPDVDLVLAVDNSCSMFGDETCKDVPNVASDPDLLRVKAAEMVINSLAADLFPRKTQISTIEFGGYANKLATLTELTDNDSRLALASKVVKPNRIPATNLVAALQAAADELDSPRHKVKNMPALLLLTDGEPTSPGNSETDILRALDRLNDVRVFVVMLLNPKMDPGRQQELIKYRMFWKGLADTRANIAYFEAKDDQEIPNIYNRVRSDLQGTSTVGEGKRGKSIPVSISKGLRKVSITVMGKKPSTTVSLLDPHGKPPTGAVVYGGAPISYSIVYVVGKPEPGVWTVEASDEVTVLPPDEESDFRVKILQPSSADILPIGEPTGLTATVLDENGKPAALRFDLLATITSVYLKDERSAAAVVTATMPLTVYDAKTGTYAGTTGKGDILEERYYDLKVEARATDGTVANPDKLKLQAAYTPVFGPISAPKKIDTGQPVVLSVGIDGFNRAQPGSVVVQATKLSPTKGSPVVLQPAGNSGNFSSDIGKYDSPSPTNAPYEVLIRMTGRTTKGQDFERTKTVRLTVTEPDWLVWGRTIGIALTALIALLLLWRFLLIYLVILLLQLLHLAPLGYLRIYKAGIDIPEETSVASIARQNRRLFTLTVGPTGDVALPDIPAPEDQGKKRLSFLKSPSPNKVKIWYSLGQGTRIGYDKGNSALFEDRAKSWTKGISPYRIDFQKKPFEAGL